MSLERQGIPTVSIFTNVFAPLARSEAGLMGISDPRLVTIPHPMETLSDAEVEAAVAVVRDNVFEMLRPAAD